MSVDLAARPVYAQAIMRSFTYPSTLTFLALGLFSACAGSSAQTPPPPPPAETTTATTAEVAPESETPKTDPNKAIVQVFGLSDFHGHLMPLEPRGFPRYYGGIANLAGSIIHRDGFDAKTGIVVDNGDMWTGPTESILLRGESVIRAYNALGVAAANVANHEFDFGQEVLRARATEAKFPFLGANIYKAGTNEHPDFVKPYTIVERDGVKVGLLGMSYLNTPQTTMATHVTGLEFRDYAEPLKNNVEALRAEGAEVIIVLFHDTVDVVEGVMKAAADLKVDAIIAGQNHRKSKTDVRGIQIVNPGPFGRSYVRFDITVDRKTRKVESVTNEIVDVTGEVGSPPFQPSPELTAVAESARMKAKGLAETALGRLGKPLQIGTFENSPLGHFVTDSWLKSLPDVKIAILNLGALREPMGSGKITVGDLMSAMPFENNVYIVKITGKQLKEQLTINEPIVSGVSWSYRVKNKKRSVVSIVDGLGKKIRDKKKYRVAILDFMYMGGDGFQFKDLDNSPEDTGFSWREPVIRAFRVAEATNRMVKPRSGARARKLR